MLALILDARTELACTNLLGLSLRTRVVLSACEAGARSIEVEPELAGWARELQADDRLNVEIRTRGAAITGAITGAIATADAAAEELPAAAPGAPSRTTQSLRAVDTECLVVRADAVLSAKLLAELALGECVIDERSGAVCAARVVLRQGDDPRSALAAARPRAFVASSERYAIAGDLSRARRVLLASLVKPSDGPVSRHLNRHLSRALTRVCVVFGVRPNHMTVLVALAGIFAAFFAAHAGYREQLLGAFLFQVHSVIDGCDGEIARLTRRFGKHGALIDSLVDDASNALFFAGLSYGVALSEHATWPWLAGVFTVCCYVGVAYIQYGVVLRSTGKGEKTAFWQGTLSRTPFWRRALHALGRRDVFVLTIMCAVALKLAPLVVVALPCMALGALLTSAGRARALRGSQLAA